MAGWIEVLSAYFGWLMGATILIFIFSISVVSYLTVRIPPDYFLTEHRKSNRWDGLPYPLQLFIFFCQQVIGVFLILVGVLMLVAPGQGILTILIGVMLTTFPGKSRLVRWLIQRKGVLRAINWIRARANKPPLMVQP